MPRSRGTRIRKDEPARVWLFGWCLPGDGNHDNCVATFTSSLNDATYACSCTCHGVSDAEANL